MDSWKGPGRCLRSDPSDLPEAIECMMQISCGDGRGTCLCLSASASVYLYEIREPE